jgi:hypothetical protein
MIEDAMTNNEPFPVTHFECSTRNCRGIYLKYCLELTAVIHSVFSMDSKPNRNKKVEPDRKQRIREVLNLPGTNCAHFSGVPVAKEHTASAGIETCCYHKLLCAVR